MTITLPDIKTIIDAITALIIAIGVTIAAIKASAVKSKVDKIEHHVNSAATKAQDVINELRAQLAREKEISAEKTQTAAVLQASSGQLATIQQKPIETVIVNPEPVSVKVAENHTS